ncbi:MAG: IS5 family transposase [Marinobacter sp.]|nr:IS5 family transposase [Marinobacter sp.]
MKDQITHLPDNADRSVAKQKFKITNWPTYNKALINRGSITFWLDDEAIQAWYESATPSSRGRPQRYSDLAITTVLVIKRVFRLTLRAAQGFIDSIFSLMNVPLRCPDYSCVSRRAKSVNISFKTPTRGEIAHLVIDSTGLKVFGEGEWKVKKHGQERRRIWRKLHLAVDSKTHEIICADLSLNNVTDSEAFPGLIRQTHRKIRAASADGAYDTRLCHDELRRKKISALIPPRKGAGYWPGEYADRNRAVANQRMTGTIGRDYVPGGARANKVWFQRENMLRVMDMLEEWRPLCAKYHCTIPALALAWILKQSDLITLLSGATSPEQVRENTDALTIALTDEDSLLMREMAVALDTK